MKKLILLFTLFFATTVFSQEVFTTEVKFKNTPNLSVPDSIVTKDSNLILRTTSIDDLKTLIGIPNLLTNIIEDLTPQLGGNLDLNTKDITGTGNVNLIGNAIFVDLTIGNDIVFGNYTSSRFDGIGINYLFTDISGNLKSGKISDITSGYVLVDGTRAMTDALNITNVRMLYQNGTRFIHNYKDVTATGENTFIGLNSGNFTLSPDGGASTLASYNVAVGDNTLQSLTTGQVNTAIGYNVMKALTTGITNSGVGYRVMEFATSAGFNTALGYRALNLLSTGNSNTAIGYTAMANFLSGFNNIGIGYESLLGLETGSTNVSIGNLSLKNIGTGSAGNVALGHNSGLYETGSNTFYLDNQDRTDLATQRTNSLIYGKFNPDPTLQELNLNANVFIGGTLNTGEELQVGDASTIEGQIHLGSMKRAFENGGGNIIVGGFAGGIRFDVGLYGLDGNIEPLANNTYDWGSSARRWKKGYFADEVLGLSFIKSGATSDDILLGDGTTTSLAGILGSVLLKTSATLSSAQILALNTTPIEIIAAQGAGTIIVVNSIVYKYNFVTTAYSTQATLESHYTGGTSIIQSVANILNSGVTIRKGSGASSIVEMEENTGISIEAPVSDPTLGDSTVDVYITYEILTL